MTGRNKMSSSQAVADDGRLPSGTNPKGDDLDRKIEKKKRNGQEGHIGRRHGGQSGVSRRRMAACAPSSLDRVSSNLPISSPYRSTPDAPVTDAERDRLNARLNAAYTAGALEQEDYQARLDLLFAARRLGELVPVVEGLPPLPTHSSPAIVASSGGEPGELSEPRPPGRLTAAVVGGVAAAVILIAILLVLLI
jgi:hypothetical protein